MIIETARLIVRIPRLRLHRVVVPRLIVATTIILPPLLPVTCLQEQITDIHQLVLGLLGM